MTLTYKVSVWSQSVCGGISNAALAYRFSPACDWPTAQVQVLSAALKAAQLDSPTDNSPTEQQPETLLEANDESPLAENTTGEIQSEETQETCTDEEQTVETPPASEPSPVQEQEDEQTQTEPQEEDEDEEEEEEQSSPGSPVQVRDASVRKLKRQAL